MKVRDLHLMPISHVAYSKDSVALLHMNLVVKSDLTISATPTPLLSCLLWISILYGSLFRGVDCNHHSSDGLSVSQVSVNARIVG